MMRKFITLLLLGTAISLSAAEKVWCMVTDSGQKIAMSNVSFVLASDASESLNIVCNNGTVVYRVSKITFEQAEPSGISGIKDDSESSISLLPASSSLLISGCAENIMASIYDGGGRLVRQSVMTSGTHEISLVGLSAGVYILKAGDRRVKFLKK